MAGTRQHYLPQFLQRGFASKKTAKACFTWVYRKDKPPFEANIEDVGVERKFYTQGTDSFVDSIITDAESQEFSRTVALARSANPGVIQSSGFPRLFAHLEVRSRHLREVFGGTTEKFIAKLTEEAEQTLPDLLLERWAKNPGSFHGEVRRMLADKGLDGLYSDRLAEQMRELAPYAMKDLRPILASAMKSIREMFPGKSAYAVKDAHINALRREIAPEVRAQHYRDLIYSVVEVHQGNLILGDNAVIFHVEGAKTFKAFCEKDDYIIGALLPVAANRLVIGAKEQYSPDPHHFRTVFAQCSHEFFVADVHSEENEVLINHIGRRSELISEQELNELVAAGFESFRI